MFHTTLNTVVFVDWFIIRDFTTSIGEVVVAQQKPDIIDAIMWAGIESVLKPLEIRYCLDWS